MSQPNVDRSIVSYPTVHPKLVLLRRQSDPPKSSVADEHGLFDRCVCGGNNVLVRFVMS
jgi:hypothetical protein